MDRRVAARAAGQIKARYERYEELLEGRRKQTQTAQIVIPVAERLGQNVIDFEHLRKGFGDNLLIDDLTFKLPAGGIVGVIGPNGAGKTTLFRMITAQDKPDSGTIEIGESVQPRLCRSIARYARRQEDRVGGDFRRSRSAAARQARGQFARLLRGVQFLVSGADQQKKVGRFPAASATACILPRC